jgi:hypothetical protein
MQSSPDSRYFLPLNQLQYDEYVNFKHAARLFEVVPYR